MKTSAVINESPTEKLIRELREENEKLKAALLQGGIPQVCPMDSGKVFGMEGEGGEVWGAGVGGMGGSVCGNVYMI